MHRSTAASSHAGTGLRRRGWLWVCGGLCTAGVMGALATHRRWWPGAAAVPEIEPEVCVVAPPLPHDPASGLALHAPRPVTADARCPVCGMFPARAPDWAAQIIFDDGDAHFFDSPLSLFMYLHDMARYGAGRQAQQIVAQYVTDAGSPPLSPDGTAPKSRWIDARTAFYVHGSSAKGPMRAGNLPAFASREAAQAFAASRGGVVLAFDGIDAPLIARLGGRSTHDHN